MEGYYRGIHRYSVNWVRCMSILQKIRIFKGKLNLQKKIKSKVEQFERGGAFAMCHCELIRCKYPVKSSLLSLIFDRVLRVLRSKSNTEDLV